MFKIIIMKFLLFIPALLFSLSVQSQTLKRTYYDYYNRYKFEEYYVNAKGETHGKYKKYSEEGIVEEESNYKNGLLDGVQLKYSTYSGRQTLTFKKTFKDGLLNGPFVAYAKGNIPIQSGNFMNDKKEGVWTFIDPYKNYDLTDAEKKGCEWYKSKFNYVDGEVQWEGLIESFYYPSGKPHSTGTYKSGKKIGEHKVFFPNGKLYSHEFYEENGKDYWKKAWYANGQLQKFESFKNGQVTYEGYDKEGNPDQVMQREMAQKEAKRIRVSGDSCLVNHNDLDCARKYYQQLGFSERQSLMQWVDEFERAGKLLEQKDYKETIRLYENAWSFLKETSLAPYVKGEYDKVKAESDKIEAEKRELASLDSTINAAVREYKSIFVEVKNTILVDANNQPITREAYPKGQFVYKKSSEVLQEMLEDYTGTIDQDEKIRKGKIVLSAFEKVNALKDSNTKDLNKQLKKVEDKNQVKAILGIQ